MPKKSKNIVLTGGHAATTALSTIEEILRSWKGVEVYWIGSKRAFEGKKTLSIEAEIFPKKGIKFEPIIMGRLQRKFTLWTIPSLIKFPFGFIHGLFLLLKIRPKIILSFGGFASFPIVFWSFFLRIPLILHEQTSAAGRANRFASPFAQKIALARGSSKKYFPSKKTVEVGNPLMTQIANIAPRENVSEPPVVFITGGSRGARTINDLIEGGLDKLLKKYLVIHQTGALDFEKFNNMRSKMKKELKKRYEVYSVIDPMEMDNLFRQADVVVSRAGANSVSEIIATKRPAILIPIPWVYLNEQQKNAEFAESLGIAEILLQSEATPEKLIEGIEKIVKDKSKIVKNAKTFDGDKKASLKLVKLLKKYSK